MWVKIFSILLEYLFNYKFPIFISNYLVTICINSYIRATSLLECKYKINILICYNRI